MPDACQHPRQWIVPLSGGFYYCAKCRAWTQTGLSGWITEALTEPPNPSCPDPDAPFQITEAEKELTWAGTFKASSNPDEISLMEYRQLVIDFLRDTAEHFRGWGYGDDGATMDGAATLINAMPVKKEFAQKMRVKATVRWKALVERIRATR